MYYTNKQVGIKLFVTKIPLKYCIQQTTSAENGQLDKDSIRNNFYIDMPSSQGAIRDA